MRGRLNPLNKLNELNEGKPTRGALTHLTI
jgi:hypothetical protein